ncbi:MAG: hypothetical protein M3N51_06650 [Actinomycetota bacterium]|nr:hypothetical protein [Actinomycetota bacterium]
MSAVAIVTVVVVGLLVLALAAYLITIALILRRVIDTLGLVTFGVRAIAHQTAPINELVTGINADLKHIDQALQGLVAEAGALGRAAPRQS